MRGILPALIDHRNPFSILTKGTLITRDVDLLVRGAEHASVSAAFSIGTLDEDVWRETEPGTPNPRARIEALRTLVDVGIPTNVLIAPILPGISDRPEQLRAVIEAALDAGATSVAPIMLHLRPGVREEFMPWLGGTTPSWWIGTSARIGRPTDRRRSDRPLPGACARTSPAASRGSSGAPPAASGTGGGTEGGAEGARIGAALPLVQVAPSVRPARRAALDPAVKAGLASED
jgi:hypothetical protein